MLSEVREMIKHFGKGKSTITFHVDDTKKVSILQYGENYLSDKINDEGIYFKPPIEIEITGRGNHLHFTPRHIACSESETLQFVDFKEQKNGDIDLLELKMKNDIIEVSIFYKYYKDTNTISSYSKIKNISPKNITLEYASNFAMYGLMEANHYRDIYLYLAHNGWYNEANWKCYSIDDLGISTGQDFKSMKKFVVSNTGSWSTKCYVPMAILENSLTHQILLFEIESNNSWAFEIGDYFKSLTLHLSGPNFIDNGYLKKLEPHQTFESVVASLTFANSIDEALEGITKYKRTILRDSIYNQNLPIVYNEYMFGSWNMPSEKTALHYAPLAAKANCDYYVIDCGWHDEIVNPFYYIGKWEESKTKYPNGLKATLDKIRSLGLKVGLWIEPECVGALGDAKDLYPNDAYFSRCGEILKISDRYHLDFRNQMVIDRLSSIIDHFVLDYGVEYFKFDYNIEPCNGSDLNQMNMGDALFEHSLAVKAFIMNIHKKYPHVLIETCASGGNRLDYSTLSVSDMVSTSDQTNYQKYPYIATNMLSLVLPEQAGIWCYPAANIPSEEIDDNKVIMNVVNSLMGRMHLASDLSKLNEGQFNLLKEGIEYYRYLSIYKKDAVPFYPNGFISRNDTFLIVGLKTKEKGFLFTYCFDEEKHTVRLPFTIKNLKIAYPKNNNISIHCNNTPSEIELKFKKEIQSCVIEFDI